MPDTYQIQIPVSPIFELAQTMRFRVYKAYLSVNLVQGLYSTHTHTHTHTYM